MRGSLLAVFFACVSVLPAHAAQRTLAYFPVGPIYGYRWKVLELASDQDRIAGMDDETFRTELTFGLNSQWADLPVNRQDAEPAGRIERGHRRVIRLDNPLLSPGGDGNRYEMVAALKRGRPG